MTSEEHARETIDGLLTKAGWTVQDASATTTLAIHFKPTVIASPPTQLAESAIDTKKND